MTRPLIFQAVGIERDPLASQRVCQEASAEKVRRHPAPSAAQPAAAQAERARRA